jgi:hypothetical protein
MCRQDSARPVLCARAIGSGHSDTNSSLSRVPGSCSGGRANSEEPIRAEHRRRGSSAGGAVTVYQPCRDRRAGSLPAVRQPAAHQQVHQRPVSLVLKPPSIAWLTIGLSWTKPPASPIATTSDVMEQGGENAMTIHLTIPYAPLRRRRRDQRMRCPALPLHRPQPSQGRRVEAQNERSSTFARIAASAQQTVPCPTT